MVSLVGRPAPCGSRTRAAALCEPAILKAASFVGSLAELGPVELVLVPSRWSRDYRQWRGLLQTHHYLGAGPLCGHQLRSLIQSAHGYVGAAAFSAAARRVAGRDQWIGWGDNVRRENLHWVVNQSRFLILPTVKVPHLASPVLAQMTARLAGDWQASYGYRPVLVESFVELSRYRGTCYQAANWQAIGLTTGRGRQDTARAAKLPRKALLVYPLQKDFRQVLCREPQRPRLVQRPAPEPASPAAPQTWQEEESGGVDLGDERLVRRLQRIAGDFWARPTMNIPQACGGGCNGWMTSRRWGAQCGASGGSGPRKRSWARTAVDSHRVGTVTAKRPESRNARQGEARGCRMGRTGPRNRPPPR